MNVINVQCSIMNHSLENYPFNTKPIKIKIDFVLCKFGLWILILISHMLDE